MYSKNNWLSVILRVRQWHSYALFHYRLTHTHASLWPIVKYSYCILLFVSTDVCFTSFKLLCFSLKCICKINNAVQNIQFVSLKKRTFFLSESTKKWKSIFSNDRSLLTVPVTYKVFSNNCIETIKYTELHRLQNKKLPLKCKLMYVFVHLPKKMSNIFTHKQCGLERHRRPVREWPMHCIGACLFFKILRPSTFGALFDGTVPTPLESALLIRYLQETANFYWNICKKYKISYSLNLNQSKTTDYQWNLTDSNSWKEVTVNQSNFTDYFSKNWLISQWKLFFHWWISEKANHWFNQWKFEWFRFREYTITILKYELYKSNKIFLSM